MLKSLRNLLAPSSPPPSAQKRVRRRIPVTVEQRVATLAGLSVPYTLKRSDRRRSISLRIDDRGLTVNMPLRASEKWLNEVLQLRAHWVVEKLDGWQARKAPGLNWADGEDIPYLGELLTLRLVPGLFGTLAHQQDGELRISARGEPDAARIEKSVMQWYKQQAVILFALRVAHYAKILGVMPREIKISTAKTRWGSCTSNGTVRLNLQLIKLPVTLIDYVVVHELAHLREMNHSAAFWRVVESACPDHVRLRRELKGVGL